MQVLNFTSSFNGVPLSISCIESDLPLLNFLSLKRSVVPVRIFRKNSETELSDFKHYDVIEFCDIFEKFNDIKILQIWKKRGYDLDFILFVNDTLYIQFLLNLKFMR